MVIKGGVIVCDNIMEALHIMSQIKETLRLKMSNKTMTDIERIETIRNIINNKLDSLSEEL